MKSLILFLFVLAVPVIGYSEDSIYKAPEYYLNRIIVEKSNIDFKKVAKFESGNWVSSSSWEKFPVNNFDSITPDQPYRTYSIIRKKVIEICFKKGIDTVSLSKCLGVIKKDGDSNPNRYIILPIAAYLTNFGNAKTWIVLCIWEWKRGLEDISGMKTIPSFGHFRNYAINPDNLKIIAFQTCE